LKTFYNVVGNGYKQVRALTTTQTWLCSANYLLYHIIFFLSA